MALLQGPDEVTHIPTGARKVFDVTGAGDTVIATLALCLSAGLAMLESCIIANHAAGIVVGEVGSAMATMEQLAESIKTQPEPELHRWK
jgi:bifunctional ADP-heptose synthase (sugar kinase/adenylyltransferase)